MKKLILLSNRQSGIYTAKSSSGFSLLEVLLSVTLLVTLAMGTAAALTFSGRGSARNVERVQALLIVETKMAEMRRAYFKEGVFPTGEDSTAVPLDMPSATKLTVNCFEEDNVTPCNFTIKIGMRRIDVKLDWVNKLGQNQTTSIVTYVYR